MALIITHLGYSQFNFLDVTTSKGFIDFESTSFSGNGVAAADYDNDGDVDLYVMSERNVQNMVYRNNGDGSFSIVEI